MWESAFKICTAINKYAVNWLIGCFRLVVRGYPDKIKKELLPLREYQIKTESAHRRWREKSR